MDFWSVTWQLLQAFGLNCTIFFVTLAFSLPLGLVVAFGSMSRLAPLRWVTRGFIYVIRSTPLMLQIMIVFFVPGLVFNIPMTNRLWPAIFAFTLNYAAYFSEIYRGGIESVPRGQYEAGQVLGMTRSQVFFKVTLLQMVKRIMPPMSNEIITLVKDTSLAYVITNKEIIMMAREFTTKGLIWPLFYTGVFFLVFNGVVTLLLGKMEHRLGYFKM